MSTPIGSLAADSHRGECNPLSLSQKQRGHWDDRISQCGGCGGDIKACQINTFCYDRHSSSGGITEYDRWIGKLAEPPETGKRTSMFQSEGSAVVNVCVMTAGILIINFWIRLDRGTVGSAALGRASLSPAYRLSMPFDRWPRCFC